MLENIRNAITRLPMDRLWRNLGGHIPSCSRHVRHDAVCGCHGNGRCPVTAHWTFCSYGRLEAERVNQFWWNLVHNSILGPQWQSRDQILKFIKFKMTDGPAMLENIGNTITRLPMDQLGRNLAGHIPSRSRHVRHNAVATATAVA